MTRRAMAILSNQAQRAVVACCQRERWTSPQIISFSFSVESFHAPSTALPHSAPALLVYVLQSFLPLANYTPLPSSSPQNKKVNKTMRQSLSYFIAHPIAPPHHPPISHPPLSPTRPPSIPPRCTQPPPGRRVRVSRKYTSATPGWQWQGASKKPSSTSASWLALFHVDDRVVKALESLWNRHLTKRLATFTALGARVLRSLTHFINRSLNPDTEADLVVEFGIAEPCPHDKNFVDPLRDWELSNVTYYRDSFGRRVYLQLDGASALVMAADYRDHFDEADEEPAEDEWAHAPPDPLERDSFFNLATPDVNDSPRDPSPFVDDIDCSSRS